MKQIMNGEHWRIITPILLSLLSALSAINIWVLGDIKATVSKQGDILVSHISNYEIHTKGGFLNGHSGLALQSGTR